MKTWLLFQAPSGIVLVPVESERLARTVIARDHWSGKDPGWRLLGRLTKAEAP